MATLAQVEELTSKLQSETLKLYGMCVAQKNRVDELTTELGTLDSETNVLTFASTTLEQLLKSVSVESVESIESLVTYGLKVSFPDQNLRFKIKIDQKRGSQHFEPILIHKEVEAPILLAFGGGAAAVVSLLLRIIVIRRFGLAPVLLLDEPFAYVSAEYVPNVAKLLRELSDQLGFTFILVSHQPKFVEYSTKAYQAVETSQGTVFKPVKQVESP
jgi:DNA repair exonuclease SbcCD ATPase subunit